MRRFIASLVAALSLATVPALALASPSTSPNDSATKCECAPGGNVSAPVPSQEPSDWVKSIWSAP
jgi:hypothetical protein